MKRFFLFFLFLLISFVLQLNYGKSIHENSFAASASSNNSFKNSAADTTSILRLKDSANSTRLFYGYINNNNSSAGGDMNRGQYNIENGNTVPEEYHLSQNYPNPFNPVTVISYNVPRTSHVSLKVYNILGKEITTLVNEVQQPGSYRVVFNGGNLTSGVYYYQMKSGSFDLVKKMILIR